MKKTDLKYKAMVLESELRVIESVIKSKGLYILDKDSDFLKFLNELKDDLLKK